MIKLKNSVSFDPSSNRMKIVTDIVKAVEEFKTNKNKNLEYLLSNRFSWMKKFISENDTRSCAETEKIFTKISSRCVENSERVWSTRHAKRRGTVMYQKLNQSGNSISNILLAILKSKRPQERKRSESFGNDVMWRCSRNDQLCVLTSSGRDKDQHDGITKQRVS